jgi:predicted lysophospholipase L1 biosynthesis ABC-type transport system permease subunit
LWCAKAHAVFHERPVSVTFFLSFSLFPLFSFPDLLPFSQAAFIAALLAPSSLRFSMSNLRRLVLSRGLALTGAGVLIGAAAALLLTRLLGNLLYKVSPRDPVAFLGAFAVMALVSVVACLLPTWRAARTDPLRALRTE